jgi:hypothetical protein
MANGALISIVAPAPIEGAVQQFAIHSVGGLVTQAPMIVARCSHRGTR